VEMCVSGRHAWFDKADAEKCCNPRWRRALLLGADVRDSEVPLQVDAQACAAYGRRWELVVEERMMR
jgi:hypothetical protein